MLLKILTILGLTIISSCNSVFVKVGGEIINNDPLVALPTTPVDFNEDSLSLIPLNFTGNPVSCSVSDLTNITETLPCTCDSGVCSVGITGTSNFSGPASFSFVLSSATETSEALTVSLNILPVNDAPTIGAIGPQSTKQSFDSNLISFTISDVDSNLDCSTSLSMTSSDTSKIQNTSVVWGGTTPNCTAVISPQYGQSGPVDLNFKVTDGLATTTQTFTFTINPLVCPSGYIPAVGNKNLDVHDFCVMKYEAKAWLDANADQIIDVPEIHPTGASHGGITATHTAVSVPEGGAWREIDIYEAKTACTNLGTGYDLISNPEWITLARDAENMDVNWSSGTVGNGCLFHGNNGIDSPCSYDNSGIDSGAARDTKARLTLKNGEQIWDLAGNAWEWVDWVPGGTATMTTMDCVGGNYELADVPGICSVYSNDDYNSSNGSFGSAEGMGLFGAGSAGSAVIRGGRWANGTWVGVYATYFDNPFGITDHVGFRCVWRNQ